ncbi:hypothetical protein BC937DRAFT_90791 [Endogone sp. FLAS-F59071]|nr:hypothetical protein BC937DRAFT_90791 [Endogone sp. FLAS-F59071]|eukprot:RUS23207.1 hypothetical protein BC937DRAFT_90791 [Endogone sp. FLAS-F59071]
MSYFGTILAEQIARILKHHFSAIERQFKINGGYSASDATLANVLENDGLYMKGEKNEKGATDDRTHLRKMMHAARKFDEHMRHLLRRETHLHQHNHERKRETGGKKVRLTTTQEVGVSDVVAVEWELLIHYRQTFAEFLIAAERFALEAEAEMPAFGRGDMDIDIDVAEGQDGGNQDHDDDSSTKHEVSTGEPCIECELDKEMERRARGGADVKVWTPEEVSVMVEVDVEVQEGEREEGCVECRRLMERNERETKRKEKEEAI